MSNKEDNFKEQFKQALVSTAKVISEDHKLDIKKTDKNSKSKIFKSARNIPNLKVIDQEGANVYDILKYKNVIFTTSSIKNFQERVSK